MTTSNYPDPPTTAFGGEAGSTAAGQGGGAKEQAKQTAGTAADQGKQVAGVAQGEAKKVASEASSQVRGLLGEATSQLEDQSRTQRDRLVQILTSVGDDLESMASQSPGGVAADLAREAADRTRALTTRLDGREPRDLLDDVRSFARRKPGLFLGSALAAGVVAGRLARGAKDAQSSSGSPASTSYSPRTEYVADSSLRGHVTDPGDPLTPSTTDVGYTSSRIEDRR